MSSTAFWRSCAIATFAMSVFGLLAALIGYSPRAAADETANALDIKGTWIVVSQLDKGTVTDPDKNKDTWLSINDTHLALNAGDRAEKLTYKLDASKSPAWLDLTTVGSDPESIAAICELKGGILKICFKKEGGARPADFVATPENGLSLLVCKRGTPPASSQPTARPGM